MGLRESAAAMGPMCRHGNKSTKDALRIKDRNNRDYSSQYANVILISTINIGDVTGQVPLTDTCTTKGLTPSRFGTSRFGGGPMARHYSPRSFFRQIPNDLLARCFKDRGLFQELDFTAMRETQPDELFKAWLELPEKHRNALEVDFREIFEMSCEKGIRAILDEANWHWREDPDQLKSFVEMFSSQPGHYHRAMITWLDHPECWRRGRAVLSLRLATFLAQAQAFGTSRGCGGPSQS